MEASFTMLQNFRWPKVATGLASFFRTLSDHCHVHSAVERSLQGCTNEKLAVLKLPGVNGTCSIAHVKLLVHFRLCICKVSHLHTWQHLHTVGTLHTCRCSVHAHIKTGTDGCMHMGAYVTNQ